MNKHFIWFYYRYLRRILESVFSSNFLELEWRYRHLYKPNCAVNYIRSFTHPHRKILVDKISEYAPFDNVLEVGCATGPNLYLLAQRFPNTNFVGVDINPEAIKSGILFFKQQQIQNIILQVGKAADLKFSNKSFDVVFTDALLITINGKQISQVAEELVRVAKKAIVLMEHHSETETGFGRRIDRWWIRNYVLVFQKFADDITVNKLSSEFWGGDWARFGCVIDVKL